MAMRKKDIASEIKRTKEHLDTLTPGTDEYNKTLESMSALSKMTDKTEMDVWLSRAKLVIDTTAAIAIPVATVCVAIVFEKDSSFTSKFGNNAIQKCLNFFDRK